MKIALSTETTIDLPTEMCKKFDIHTTPFSILLGDELIEDCEGVSQKIFEYVKNNKILPKTSAVNREQYRVYFEKLLKDYDQIIHISLSSHLSSAFDNAKSVASEFDNKIIVVDSLSLSTGIALLVLYARKLIDKGLSLSEIAKKVQARVPYVQASFVVDTLEYLYKGGRCNSLQYFGANLLKIKPEIVVENGQMHSSRKFLGLFKNVMNSYFNDIMQKCTNPDYENVFITYSTADPKVVDDLREKLKEKGFKNIYNTTAGGTISSHCGPGCLGILFINDGGNIE